MSDAMPAHEPDDTSNDSAGAAVAAPRSIRRSLAAIVLGFEVIVVFLAALVIWGLAQGGVEGSMPSWVALAAGGIIIVGLVATIGLLRFSWAYPLGWVIQVLIVASGFLNPAMFVVGALFGGMWWYCMVAGARIDRERAAAAAQWKEQE
ncbi:DUF4233 domain-containing protein [Agromyces badenianii]|uniref:DUF4233 domain-containing protein n=1 Tax=Agromyces badenianii TaxID=2080742 RepID=A0A2S0WW51_9MICO|nr:DUF4233 domain-containing protein [Agromyces badenianii]AWB95576.1 DUF4233 domain-containing protein [Agromyces badenianii]PWC04126.1 DUF4233 domain-containing protein [Agromyces badenianii]